MLYESDDTTGRRGKTPTIPPYAENFKMMGITPVNEAITLYALTPHMHLRGKSMKWWVTYPDGREETILDVPNFDFNWQIQYELAEPLKVPAGSKITNVAIYDNSVKNRWNPAPEKDVYWSEQSWDEMYQPTTQFSVDSQDLTEDAEAPDQRAAAPAASARRVGDRPIGRLMTSREAASRDGRAMQRPSSRAGCADRRRGRAAAARRPPQPSSPRARCPRWAGPRKPDDPAPLLDFFAYFKGAWNVTWDYPESPLGPADVLTGTTTFTAEGTERRSRRGPRPRTPPASSRSPRSSSTRARRKTITRTVTDSRGFSFTQSGTVAGDLGGQFTIRLDGAPVHAPRATRVRVNSVMRLLSPLNYRTQTTISVDGGPFTNFGNPVVAQGGHVAMTRSAWYRAAASAPRSAAGTGVARQRPTRCRSWPSPAACRTRATTWLLTSATDPVPSIANAPPAGQPIRGRPPARSRFRLIGVSEFDLPAHKGHTVLVKGPAREGRAREPRERDLGDDGLDDLRRAREVVPAAGRYLTTLPPLRLSRHEPIARRHHHLRQRGLDPSPRRRGTILLSDSM